MNPDRISDQFLLLNHGMLRKFLPPKIGRQNYIERIPVSIITNYESIFQTKKVNNFYYLTVQLQSLLEPNNTYLKHPKENYTY